MDPDRDAFRQGNALQDFHIIYGDSELIPNQIKAIGHGIPVDMKCRGRGRNIQHISVPGGSGLYQRQTMFHIIFRQQLIVRRQQGAQDFLRQLPYQDVDLNILISVNMTAGDIFTAVPPGIQSLLIIKPQLPQIPERITVSCDQIKSLQKIGEYLLRIAAFFSGSETPEGMEYTAFSWHPSAA